ncbi:MAG: hypothetical protein KTR29_03760 [Rhodothermaceae bacterium]|nr:hypothetical protein [Rhodothermaceae bacterium]
MKTQTHNLRAVISTVGIAQAVAVMLFFCLFTGQVQDVEAQIAVMQYRHVPAENVQEFVRRETTYWSAIAEKAIQEDKMMYWAMWQKVGGWNLDTGSNFLFMNVFADKTGLDNVSGIWDPTTVFPEMNPADISTEMLSTTKHMLVVESIADAGNEEPQFLRMNYGKVHDPEKTLEIEMNWKTFIEEQMEQGNTTATSWRFVRVLTPAGASIPFDVISMDGFQSLSEAVYPTWADDVEFPDMTGFDEAQTRDRVSVYARVKSVSREAESGE